MKKILEVDGINIQIDVKETGQELGKYQFSSRKYDIWCFSDSWEEASELLIFILKDRAKAFMQTPYSQMPTKHDREVWKTYQKLVQQGLSL